MLLPAVRFGVLAERLKALVLKTNVGNTTGGSNPSYSAGVAYPGTPTPSCLQARRNTRGT